MAYSNKSISSFWMDDDFTFSDYDILTGEVKLNKGKDLFKLASYKRAISNFVTIVTQQNIPVKYGTKDSYTDGTSIVLSAGMNDKDFDPNVGLALHEASHIKLTDFNLLTQLVGNTQSTYPEIYKEIYDYKQGEISASKLDTIKNLLNYVEDRRIDLYMFKNAPGYKGYYLSMYDKYFHARVIDKALQSNKKRSETWDSYMFRIINMTNPNRDLTALKGLKEIYKAIGFNNIGRLKTTQDALEVAFEIFLIVEKYIKKDKKKQQEGDQGGSKKSQQGESQMKTPGGQAKSEENTDDQSGLTTDFTPIDGELTPTSNLSDNAKELTDSQKRQLEKAIAKQEKFQEGNIKKSNLAKSDEKKLEAIAESGSELKNVGNDVERDSYWNSGDKQFKGTNVLVVDKITDSIIENNVYTNIDKPGGYRCNRYLDCDDIRSAITLGKLLGKKLKMRNEERSTIYNRLGNGKIDRRLISALGHGYERVFYNVETDKFNNASIHISIDGSGSMSGDKFKQTAKATIAIATAANAIQGLDVTVSYRSTEYVGNTDTAAIFILYKSKRDSIKRLYKIMPLLTLNGTTPEGLCFEAIQKLITQGNDNHDSYFINLSDGQPYFGSQGYSYSGPPARRHTKRQCDTMKANGIKILSYFISSSSHACDSDIQSFKQMYGRDASFVNCNGLAGLAKSLNKLFLTK
jgi:hypothetical protein